MTHSSKPTGQPTLSAAHGPGRRPARRGLRPALLGVAIAALLPGIALAGSQNGGVGTIRAGDPIEDWRVYNNGELRIIEGGTAGAVRIEKGSILSMDHGNVVGTDARGVWITSGKATLVDSAITNALGNGMSIGVTRMGGTPDVPSEVTAYRTLISGVGSAINTAAEARIQLYDSELIGRDNGGTGFFDGGIGFISKGSYTDFNAGTTVTGDKHGLMIVEDNGLPGPGEVATGATFVVDQSTITGIADSAIVVANSPTSDTPIDTVAEISLRNGAQLHGGNGVMLDVRDAATANVRVDRSDLVGDVVVADTATANLFLGSASTLVGRLDNVTRLELQDRSMWTLTGDSQLGTLALGAQGVVALGDGSRFNTLTVTGDFAGAGGTLLFNAVLGDDASARDRLVVNGATSGQTHVLVNNVGGAGAYTADGIQLIRVDGASDGQFDLSGRAVAGQHEYFLFKGGKTDPNDGDWYLRSELEEPVDPCLADPAAEDCGGLPTPVLRPEPGAYLANQTAAVQMFGQRHHDRSATATAGARGAWARVTRTQADYGVIGDQLGVDGDTNTNTLQVGTDVWAWGEGRGQAGVMAGHGSANNTVTSRLTGYAARGKVTGNMIGAYASWAQQPQQEGGLYLDASVQHGRFDNSVQGDALAKERYDSRTSIASVEAGYGLKVFDSGRSALFVEPQLQVGYRRYAADRVTETNGTIVDDAAADGLASRVGVRVFGHATTAAGHRVQPFVAVNWLRESSQNSLRFDGERLAGGLPGNRYEAKAGAALTLGQRWSAWGDLGAQRGDHGYREVAAQIGLRARW